MRVCLVFFISPVVPTVGDPGRVQRPRLQEMSALVELVDVSKRYADAPALHPTNLAIERGKTTVLIGPSGCGKSTLLRLIIGLITPDSGAIAFDGSQITPANIDTLRRRIGYVIQEGGLFPHLTARANILLMARYLGKSHGGNAHAASRIMRADKIFRQFALAIPDRTFRRSASTRQLNARIDAFARTASPRRTSRRARSAGARFFAKGSQRNFRALASNNALRHSRFGRSSIFR